MREGTRACLATFVGGEYESERLVGVELNIRTVGRNPALCFVNPLHFAGVSRRLAVPGYCSKATSVALA